LRGAASIMIHNGRALLQGRLVAGACILIQGGKISYVGEGRPMWLPPGARIVDAGGCMITPGFIDLHVHGGLGSDFMDATAEDIDKICRFHAEGGTTALLATTASAPLEQILRAVEEIGNARSRDTGGARVLGAHIEGPYFAMEKRGCHKAVEIRNPVPEEYERLLELSSHIKSMTLAPELPGALRLIRRLAELDIVPCAGHSDATYEQVRSAVQCGLRHVTHLYCAMSSITRTGPVRKAGLLEAALEMDELTTEVIADGKHLPHELIRLALKAKGTGRVCAVTDAMRGAGMPDGIYTFGGRDGEKAVVKNGESRMMDDSGYASSVVRCNDMLRVLVNDVGLKVEDALRMLTENPSKVLNLNGKKGELAMGRDGDVVIMNDRFDVLMTIVEGKVVFEVGA